MDGWLSALGAYSVQVLLVVAAATAAQALCGLSHPALRLAWWRGVALLCLALPLLAPGPSSMNPATVVFTPSGSDTFAAVPLAAAMRWPSLLIVILVVGVAIRLGWLLLGAARLRRLRRGSVPVDLGPEIAELCLDLAPEAEVRASPAVRQPVTFGFRRPVILVPERLLSMPVDQRRAVACHELLHVRRRDWVWILVEEHARAVFWFHPGVWWLLEQIQISREQLIDRLVVDRLASKRAYMSALLSFVDGGAALSSTAFIRRHQLRARLRLLSQESPMSRTHLAWTAAALMLVTVAAAGAARAIPLELPVLTAQSAPRLEIRLAETDPASGLFRTAVAGSDREIYVHASALATSADVTSAGVIEWNGTATPVTPRGSAGRAISGFAVAVRFTDAAAARLAAAAGVHLGRPIAILVDGRVISAPVLRSAIGDAGVISGLSEVESRALAEALDPASSQRAPIADAGDAGIIPPRPIHQVRPFYTPEAMLAGLAGSVVMSAVVDADGSVGDVVVTRSLDRKYGLDEQAVKAAKGWTFAPGTRGGVPVAVRVMLETEFTMRSSR